LQRAGECGAVVERGDRDLGTLGLPGMALGGIAHDDANRLLGGEQRVSGGRTRVSSDSSDDVHDSSFGSTAINVGSPRS
jgi:hypothetical protein